jgi:hypothetical protein
MIPAPTACPNLKTSTGSVVLIRRIASLKSGAVLITRLIVSCSSCVKEISTFFAVMVSSAMVYVKSYGLPPRYIFTGLPKKWNPLVKNFVGDIAPVPASLNPIPCIIR